MAAFSRGLGLAMTQRIFSFAPPTASKSFSDRPMARVALAIRRSPILQAARNLQTCARLQAARTPHPARAQKPARTDLASLPTSMGKVFSPHTVASRLASRGGPVVLYEASNHFWLRFAAISAALSCVTFAGVHYYTTVLYPPPGLAWYVPVAYSLVSMALAMLGWLFLFSTARIVCKITAIPTTSLPQAYLKPGSANMSAEQSSALKKIRASPIVLECLVNETIPLLGNSKIVAVPSDVLTAFKWMQAPVSRGMPQPRGALLGLRRGLMSEGFAPIMIKGRRYKIDVFAGKVFDNGSMLDSLMPYRPSQFTFTWVDKMLKR